MGKKRLYESVPRPESARVADYRRFSSPTQPSGTLQKQEMNIQEAIARIPGWTLTIDFCDPGRSAATDDLAKRPQFAALLEAAKRGEFDAVMVESADRWARDEAMFFHSMNILRNAGVYWLTADGLMDSEKLRQPGFDIASAISISQAASASRVISKKVADGKRSRVRRGYHSTNTPVFGYCLSDPFIDPETGRIERIHEPDDNFPALAIMADLRIQGQGRKAIVDELNRQGYRQHKCARGKVRGALVDVSDLVKDERPISVFMLNESFKREFYVQYGATEHGTIVGRDGARHEGRHIYAWTRGTYTRIREATAALYHAPQAQIHHRLIYPLAGLLVCADCGVSMGCDKYIYKATQKLFRYYICGRMKSRGICSAKRRYHRCDGVEDEFGLLLSKTTGAGWEEALESFLDGIESDGEEETRQASRQTLEAEKNHLNFQHRYGGITDEEYAKEIQRILQSLSLLQPAAPKRTAEDLRQSARRIADVAECWEVATYQERREMSHLMIQPLGMIWHADTGRIIGIRPYAEFLPGFTAALTPEYIRHGDWLWDAGYPIPRYIGSEATA